MFDSTQQSTHILLHAKICEEDLFVRQVEKPSVTLTKGGLTATPYNFLNIVKGESNIFKGGLNPPTPTGKSTTGCAATISAMTSGQNTAGRNIAQKFSGRSLLLFADFDLSCQGEGA